MRGEARRLAKEVDDFLHLVLGLVDTRHVLESHDVLAALGDARPPGDRRDASRCGPIDGEREEREERRRRRHRASS